MTVWVCFKIHPLVSMQKEKLENDSSPAVTAACAAVPVWNMRMEEGCHELTYSLFCFVELVKPSTKVLKGGDVSWGVRVS